MPLTCENGMKDFSEWGWGIASGEVEILLVMTSCGLRYENEAYHHIC